MIRKLAVAIVAGLALTGCKPFQVDKIEEHLQVEFSDEFRAQLEALPDEPARFGRTIIDVDGTVATLPCEEVAAPEAHVYGDPTAALQTFRAVACERGWPIEIYTGYATTRFLTDVLLGESGGCWNVRRGARITNIVGCDMTTLDRDGNVITLQGSGSDAGYGQLIGMHYRNGAWLCTQEGLCSAEDITASPHASMTALVAMIERNGKQPWCFNAWARRYHHTCNSTPRRIWPW